MAKVPLTNEHIASLAEIRDALRIPSQGDSSYPANFHRLTPEVGARVAEPIAQLPATADRNRLAQEARESTGKRQRMYATPPRTTYADDRAEMVA